MNNSGEAAEQVVRLSLEGMEVTAKLTGTAAKHIAILLFSVLKQEQKTRGKARLTSMIKSGKELKVFAVPQKDLETFVKHAKQYGVLYCVLKDKNNTTPNAVVDIITRAEDSAKIQRIFEKYNIGKVEEVSITNEEAKINQPEHREAEQENPFANTTDKEVPSEPNSMRENTQDNHSNISKVKKSVKERLNKAKSKALKELSNNIPKEVSYRETNGR